MPDDDRKDRRGKPVGIERATRTAGAPPRPSPRGGKPRTPPRPDLPDDGQVDLPKGVVRELKRQIRGAEDREAALVAMTIASDALEDEDGVTARLYLEWLKAVAPRSPAVREGLGIALYLTQDYSGALSELQTYRRMTGRPDQNHVLADCLRALERGTDRIPELIEEMDEETPADRLTEGVIVWASHLGDRGDLSAGRAVVRRRVEGLDREDGQVEEHHLRLWYVAADLADRDGDAARARELFARISEHVEGYFDTEERLAALS